jgi:hypothetical protein
MSTSSGSQWTSSFNICWCGITCCVWSHLLLCMRSLAKSVASLLTLLHLLGFGAPQMNVIQSVSKSFFYRVITSGGFSMH